VHGNGIGQHTGFIAVQFDMLVDDIVLSCGKSGGSAINLGKVFIDGCAAQRALGMGFVRKNAARQIVIAHIDAERVDLHELRSRMAIAKFLRIRRRNRPSPAFDIVRHF
jgi:hypothetical protein